MKEYILFIVNWQEYLVEDLRFKSVEDLGSWLKEDDGVFEQLMATGEAELEDVFNFKLVVVNNN